MGNILLTVSVCFKITILESLGLYSWSIEHAIIYNIADIDECTSSETNECDPNALCTNTEASYVCRCKKGYTGDGRVCEGTKLHPSLWLLSSKNFINFT